jgi:hypothetical protein
VSLVDREVHVRLKIVDDREYWNFAWPREKAKPVSFGALQHLADGIKGKIAEARKSASKSKRAKVDAPSSVSANGKSDAPSPTQASEKPLPDVGY